VRSRATLVGLALVTISGVVYWVANRGYDAGRGDFFYLADAFLQGRTWLDIRLGPWDVIPVGDRFYVPFAPFPGVVLIPVVALPIASSSFRQGIMTETRASPERLAG
jgi:hypothetical protein